ncbi:uncharacterized protein N7515_001543 [Penicillium bovifimosum]|uniref:Uncharacterized protein n=1 Tax=Penicillium bovifimosum TaxID=126998 RepID=A0A9W9L8H0_9EURO|nr:uncharacterized protein N7515_001543 [Penicillium bovifimosum]KAJ5142756.1 hypothetical protein N7515_001543 [Penicillium bovifimosum]
MKPGPLDMGFARPLEFTLSVVVRNNPSPLDFQFAADTLVSQWPVLNLRMDPLKTKFLDPTDPGDLTDVWAGRTLKKDLSEIICFSSNRDYPQMVDTDSLNDALDFGYGILHAWKQRVFAIRTVFLTDACIIGFKFLQPLCDANGAHHIIQAYCSLLRGERISHTVHARPSLSLKSEVLEKCAEMIESHRIADLHKHTMDRTWIAGISAIGKQIGRNICYRSARRVAKTLFVPQRTIQSWLKEAESQKAKVTEHDLLVAFIFTAALHPPKVHTFGIAIDISKQLQSEANLYNPWYMMPLPDPVPSSEYSSLSLIQMATHIRVSLDEAQQPECIGEVVEQHKTSKGKPMVPKLYGGRAAQPRIASWKNLPLFDLDIQGENPLFVQGSVDYCGLLRETRSHLDDLLVTWKAQGLEEGKGGYWVHGRLPEAVWRHMADELGC